MGLRQNIHEDTVGQLDLRPLVSVGPKATVRQAIEKMRQARLGCVIVLDKEGKPIGKFTERKLIKLLVENAAGMDQPVEKFMYNGADSVSLTDAISTMVQTMNARSLRFLTVVDENGKAVALTGQKGLMQYICEHFPRQIKVQSLQSKLHMDQREGA